MKLTVTHPESSSLQAVRSAESSGVIARRSPHVGNVSKAELDCILGLAELGVPLQLEVVDTIHGNDSYSQPRFKLTKDDTEVLVSQKQAKNKIVGSLTTNSNEAILDVHMQALTDVLPEHVRTMLSSEYFGSIGRPVLIAAITASQQQIDRPLRFVAEGGKIRPFDGDLDESQLYSHASKLGVLPPLEAMMALEVLEHMTRNKGIDGRIVHIGGPDMITYTKSAVLMATTDQIVQKAVAELGLDSNVTIEYVVPCMATINADPETPKVVPINTVSQHDLAGAQQ